MNTPNVFPIYRHAVDMGNWVSSPELAIRIWKRIRATVAPDAVWYAVAMKIASPTTIVLRVFDMECTVTGGIGNELLTHEVTRDDMTPDECAILDDLLITEYTDFAEDVLVGREKAARRIQVEAIRKELFGM